MSSDCGNCDCADKSQSKKGNKNTIEIVASPINFECGMEVDMGAENDCKCGPGCKCNGCSCHN